MRSRAALIGVTALLLAACGGDETASDETVARAQAAYHRAEEAGVDFTNGPCLGVIEPGWVADVAHDPRQPVDDEPENQCEAYRNGEADHYVELDPDGELIRSG
jgi:hypothetical protein